MLDITSHCVILYFITLPYFTLYLLFQLDTELLPDFFLDEFEENQDVMRQLKANKVKSDGAAPAGGDQVSGVFQKIQGLISDELVKSVDGVFQFKLSGDDGEWYLDLKNSPGKPASVLEFLC